MKQYILLFLIIISNQLRAEDPFWEKLPGPNIGEVRCFADLPNGDILIGAYTGVYKSSDLGKNWHQVFNSLRIIDLKVSKKGVIAIITGEYFYSPSGDNNIFLSYDNGQTWDNILRVDYKYKYNKIVFTDKEELLIFTLNNNEDSAFINKSTNYGINWQKSGIEILNNNNNKNDYYYDPFFDCYSQKNNLYLTGYRSYWRKNIYENYLLQSSDYGKSFSKVLTLNTMSRIINNVYEDNSGNVYVNYVDSIDNKYLIRKSTDSCKTWETIPCDFSVDKFEKKGNLILAYEAKKLINDRYNFVYATTDEGKNWIKLNPDKKFYYINFHIINDSLVLLAHYEGIELINIKTNRSENAAKGLASGVIYDIGFVKNKVFVTCCTGVYVSSDDGMTWESCNANSQQYQRINTLSDGTLVLTGVDHYYDRVYEYGMLISYDEGKNWNRIDTLTAIDAIVELKNGDLLARFYKSTDRGRTWFVNVDIFNYQPIIEMAKNRLGDIFISLFNKGLYVSKDEGKTFNKVSDFYPWNLTFHPNLDYGWGSNCETTDNGKTWLESNSTYITIDSLSNPIFIKNYPKSNMNYYDIKNKKNNSINRNGIDTTIWFNNIRTAPNGYVYLATNGDGLYRSRQKYVSVKEEPALTSNYLISPNPASDYIEIRQPSEGLKPSEGYNIQIFNIFGEKVEQTSLSVQNSQTGMSDLLKIDISSLPEGVYFIKIGDKFEKFVKM